MASLRALIALVAVAALAWSIRLEGGFFSPAAGLWCAAGCALAVLAALGSERRWRPPPRDSRVVYCAAGVLTATLSLVGMTGGFAAPAAVGGVVVAAASGLGWLRGPSLAAALLSGVALVLSASALPTARLSFQSHDSGALSQGAAVAGFLSTLALVLALGVRRPRRWAAGLALAAVAACAVIGRGAVILASANANSCDVQVAIRGAADYLLAGQNPYGAEYASAYDGEVPLRDGEWAGVELGEGRVLEVRRFGHRSVIVRPPDAPGARLVLGDGRDLMVAPGRFLRVRTWRGSVKAFCPDPGRPAAPADLDAYPFYPPLPFLVTLPFRAAGLDGRWAYLVCDLIAAGGLVLAGRRRGQPELGALGCAVYLLMPHTALLYAYGWYEPVVAALLAAGLLLVECRRRAGYLVLALGLTAKQYGVVLLVPLLRAFRGQRRLLFLGILAAAVGTLVPFFLWGPDDFLRVVLFKHLQLPNRTEAITVHTVAGHYLGVRDLGRPQTLPLAGLLIGLVAWRTPAGGASPALWMGTALLVFFFFHNQGFYNYYYLCIYLLLLGVACTGPQTAPVDTPAAGTGRADTSGGR
jgi:hypothetical protein